MRGKPASERFSERQVFRVFQRFFRGVQSFLEVLRASLDSKGFQSFSRGFQRSSQRPSQRQISLSEALSLVAPDRVAT